MVDHNEILQVLFDRLSRSGSRGVVVTYDEFNCWPAGMLAALEGAGLLKPTSPAKQIVCPGCPQNCHRPVITISGTGARPARHYVNCDQMPDVAPIAVTARRLARKRISPKLVANYVANELDIEAPGPPNKSGLIQIGSIKGRHGRRNLFLDFKDEPALKIGADSVPLANFLCWDGMRVAFERDEVEARINAPISHRSSKRYESDTTKREARKILTQRRYQDWIAESRRITSGRSAKHNLTKTAVAKIIEKRDIAQGRKWSRIIKFI